MLGLLTWQVQKFRVFREIDKICKYLYPTNNTDFFVREIRYLGIFLLSTDVTF